MIIAIVPVVGAMLVGASLGVLGSGGSILAVPILVFLLGHPEKVAIAESLAIVGALALAGAISSAWMKQVDSQAVVRFGLPAMAGAYFGAWISQWIPEWIQMLMFAMLLVPAAWRLLSPTNLQSRSCRPGCLVGSGIAVGAFSGLVGIGGGFLAVPALILLGGLKLRVAAGTSLVVIALSSAVGFTKHLHLLAVAGQSVDWSVILLFVTVGMAAAIGGQRLATRIPQTGLRRGFGAFLLCMTVITVAGTVWH